MWIPRFSNAWWRAMAETLISIAMIGVFALAAGAVALWRRGGSKRQAVWMALAATVLLGNVLIIAWPA